MYKFILLLTLIFSQTIQAQRAKYGIGTMVLNLGIGLHSTIYDNNFSPSFSFSAERGIVELGPGKLGVGGIVQYQTSSFKYGSSSSTGLDYSLKSLNIGVRGVYHPDILNSNVIDVYGALMFGYSSNQNSYTPYGNYVGTIPNFGPSNSLNVGICAGIRTYIKPKIGIFGEFGYDISPIKLGLCAKF